ncbi:site-specific DNA-methyltransferase [Providencia rettgeri]|uniref:DNA-methyltransferase n=1 Tax=Providencia rettgeri TaxID=587 RepID=UPI001C8363BD|nr:site-specific DNA-methyltransferase [Providencia rettgeri]MBX6968246.1 site-specific DNA-methyltransferase [Providencia rettgeri]MBX6978009.1 site-specific DNA-methyltransferase [Providencia rettgeri]MBX6994976.1 site-specific DNA-methyltransferase [Providencia rettgeri]MBX6996111.1 site-specific DNA-methyltransferase [Providencia rettgeri]MBX7017303.1 site-specific DNA-methyltransferase [Providencia rettgeri]
MKNTVNLNSINLVNDDSLSYIKTLPDNCIDLIATDPPYFQVKSCSWDNQWENVTAYLSWLDEMLAEFWRVLKPNGSLYMFCGSKLAADTELLVRERFDVLNHIIWAKPSGPWRRQNKESLRSYFPATERILFAEHYQSPYKGKSSGYLQRRRELKENTLKPLIKYFKQARDSLGITAKEIHQATGKQMASHWFGYSQWQLPNESDYLKLQELFNQVAVKQFSDNPLSRQHADLVSEQKLLNREYHELSQQYQLLRRPFTVTVDVPYTDVWTYPPVQYYPGKHPCEKPAVMMEHIINSSSREGDVVADFFMGSGATIKAALKLNRRVIGVELETDRFEQTKTEINKTSSF